MRTLLVLLWAVLILSGELLTRPQTASAAVHYQGAAGQRRVALVCNVVWGTPYVPQILQTLEKNRVRVSFFLGGIWAERHPELVKALARAGMELGNHGYGHRHVGQMGLTENEAEITRAEKAIYAASGVKTSLYGPAYGEHGQAVERAAQRLGYEVVYWSVDTIDWRPSSSPEAIVERVSARLHDGAIILMHPTERTVAALPELLRLIRARGFTPTTVSEVLDRSDLQAGRRSKNVSQGAGQRAHTGLQPTTVGPEHVFGAVGKGRFTG